MCLQLSENILLEVDNYVKQSGVDIVIGISSLALTCKHVFVNRRKPATLSCSESITLGTKPMLFKSYRLPRSLVFTQSHGTFVECRISGNVIRYRGTLRIVLNDFSSSYTLQFTS